jgi:hypothetical protein
MRLNRLLCLTLLILAIPATLFAQLRISITIAPPELVVYSQPSCPQSGYLWMPGYWAYGAEGYYWVPGTWVEPPAVGVLWTPGYWAWVNDGYVWNPGYWGPTVGFYGGINYGYGYNGVGYGGGYWNNGAFYYNRSVNNVDVAIVHNTYVRTVNSPRAGSYVSYNGGPGGTGARPTTAQVAAAHGGHRPATSAQTEHRQAASRNHELLASVNHGKPPIAATSRPGGFTGKGIVAARGAAAEAKADQKKVVASGPTENKVAQKKAATARPTESRASEKRATTTRPTENKATTEKATATHPTESRASEKRAATIHPTENKATTEKAPATHTSENKAPEKPADATRSNENRTAHSQPEAIQQHKAPSPQARAESALEKKSPGGEAQPRP